MCDVICLTLSVVIEVIPSNGSYWLCATGHDRNEIGFDYWSSTDSLDCPDIADGLALVGKPLKEEAMTFLEGVMRARH